MPIAVVAEFDVQPGDRSTLNYDAMSERLNAEGDPLAGLILHTAGFDDGDVFRIFDVWETGEDARRFAAERLQPVLAEGPRDPTRTGGPNREYRYELHHVIKP